MSDDPRFAGYWAAIRADLSKQTVDAVIRLADNEQEGLRAEVEKWKTAAADFEAAYVAFRGPSATDYELARRLEWAIPGNGRANLERIRDEGLHLIAITPEDPM